MTSNRSRWIPVGLLGLSLIVAVIVTQTADGKAQSTDNLGNHSEIGDAVERLELARTIMRNGDLDQMEKEAAPLLRKIAIAIDEQPNPASQAWLLLAEIHQRLRDEFLSLTGQTIDPLKGSMGEALIKQGKKDLGMEMLIREAWLLRMPAELQLELLYTYPVEGFQPHDTRILKFYDESSAEGIPRSQFFMGKILLNGWGVPRDEARAIELLWESGLGEAFMELATYYFREGDMAVTEEYLEQAAAVGVAKAHYNLGVLAQQRGDYSKAISRFEKTLEVDSEYVEARLELARMYVEGWGVKRNAETGFEMMKRIADTASGDAAVLAQMNVGNFYREGTGTDRDLGLARQYYQKALDGGYFEAEKALNQLDNAMTAPVFASNKTGPSFDCSKASTAVEHSICGSEELSALDREMATAYKTAESSAPSGSVREALLLVEQRLWNKGRASKCTENDQAQKTDCLAKLYRRRILELTAQAEDVAESEEVSTQDASDMLQRGHEMKRAGDVEKAIEFYKKSLAIDPSYSYAENSLKSALRVKKIADYVKEIESDCGKKVKDIEVKKYCLQKYFLFDGKPIHPLLIQDFVTWLSDGGDQVVAINIEDSQGSNRYCCEDSFTVEKKDNKMEVKIDLVHDFSSQQISEADCRVGCWFTYRFEGTTDDGVSLVRTWDRGGGSGVFSSLLFLRVKERNALQENSSSKLTWDKKQIVLEKLGEVALGDRQNHTIEVDGNFLILDGRRISLEPN